MYATFLDVPGSVSEELEQAFSHAGLAIECRHLSLANPSGLPQVLPPGLVVLWDAGGPLEEMARTCKRLASLSVLSRTCLLVLTRRDKEEQHALLVAGASQCLSSSGDAWGPNLIALADRLGLPTRTGAYGLPVPSRVPPERALQTLLAATTADLGHDFFRTLVKQLAEAFRVTCAMVGEMLPERGSVSTLAFWYRGSFQQDVTYPLLGTPCHNTVSHSICHYADEVATRFPQDLMLSDMGLRGYLGAALRSSRGEVIGVLAILNEQVLDAGEMDFSLMGAFAARAGAELERIRAHAELERTRDFLRNTLDAVPDPLFVKDREHRLVAVNSAFCRLVGGSPETLLGQSSTGLLPSPDSEHEWEQDERAFFSGHSDESERSFTDPSGLPRTFLTRRAVFPGANGQPALVGVIRDLTERKRLETQLRLADRMASMGTLAAGVAHEINNPLAYVCSNLTFLAEELAQPTIGPDLLPELREVVAETQEGAGRVRSIVQDLKRFARSDEDQLGPINLHQVIERALKLVRSELQRSAAQLDKALEPVPAVLGNEARLGQVLVNLLVNATQAFPQRRTENNRIRVTTRLGAAQRVVVEVEDNGMGMSPEVQQRIFDPFFTTKAVGQGTGLGLAICHTIIQSMSGEIDVRSAPGRGTTFVVTLPAFSEVEVAQAESARALAPETLTGLDAADSRGMRETG